MNPVETETFERFAETVEEFLPRLPSGQGLITKIGAENDLESRRRYRLSRYQEGLDVIRAIERDYFPLEGKTVLDIACGFGGQLAAFATRPVHCVGVDFINFHFPRLREVLNQGAAGARVDILIGDMNALPFQPESFDLVFSNAGLEHLTNQQVRAFLGALRHLLKPGGVAVLGLTVAVRGLNRDPYYGLPLISVLPAGLKRLVAEGLFRRTYPWPLRKTFLSFSAFRRQCTRQGLQARSFLFPESNKVQKASRWPFPRLWFRLMQEVYWDYVIVRRVEG